jgi:putative transposase
MSTAKRRRDDRRVEQLEAGRTAAGVERELGVPKHTIYAWEAKYGGLEVKERSG